MFCNIILAAPVYLDTFSKIYVSGAYKIPYQSYLLTCYHISVWFIVVRLYLSLFIVYNYARGSSTDQVRLFNRPSNKLDYFLC